MAHIIDNDEAEQMAAMWQNEAEIAQAKVKELEERLREAQSKVKNLGLFSVSQQRELLIAFSRWMDENVVFDGIRDEEIDSYLTELKSNLQCLTL